ncbi:DNA replication complex GINS protein PSF1 [Chondrus crispus]|uniref:DNA replication complex GINS protein PSF1 n=1 Tax=Chondrus crispus TaxID=2769 RepID=R7Q900_CHOCR|nr:DNA replication complex GINS protein PSF1 [Chondrus crispus]CDF34293.1 DNA replication complex GINS protein PSF1 [Chondrus crispus]|eukprot:XP_005714112.1 DNA replication complex GINS protein PSF1 [Chondrus crispus]
MHGRRGAELLEELRKTKWLPPYSESGIRQIAAEIKELLEPFLEIITAHRASLQNDPRYISGVVVFYRSVQRNKRCALAYLMNRLRRIVAFRWLFGQAAPARLDQNLSGAERQFLLKYNALLGEYCDAVGLDLTADQSPPRDLYVEVRVIADCGDILTEAGPVALKPGTAHFLKRTDVEHLIRQGSLQHIL